MTSSNILLNASTDISTLGREELLDVLARSNDLAMEWIRRQVIDNDRIDILAEQVLGYEVQRHHASLLRWQFLHPDNLQLCFRGAGKTTVLTIAKAIHLLIKDRDLRIVIASKTMRNAQSFLKEIKAHMEQNQRLIEVFGAFYDPRIVSKWDDTEIEIVGKKRATKEANITCVGVDSAVVSRHYDVMIADDLVNEENSATPRSREKLRTFYYQSLLPTIEPPDRLVRHRGDKHRHGTRFHYQDLYGHLMEPQPDGSGGELANHTQIIPALDDQERSPWPEKFPPDFFRQVRRDAGTVIYNAQYQCDTSAMKGEVFQYDDCIQIPDSEPYPDIKRLRVFMGVDLAISQKDTADQFAVAVIGLDGPLSDPVSLIWVLDFYASHLRFSQQTTKILEMYDKWDPILGYIEANGYQAAQFQQVVENRADVRLRPKQTDQDKMARAWKLSPLFETRRFRFRRSMGPLIDQLVMFPSAKLKDLFDALDLAVAASRRKRRRQADRVEPGLI